MSKIMWGERITDTEREQALKEHREKQEKMIKKGRVLVLVFAVYHIITTIIGAISNFNIFVFSIRIVLVCLLLFGHSWVKYLFAIGAGLSALVYMFLLLGGVLDFSASPYGNLIVAAMVMEFAVQIFTCIMFFTSKSITEYMYIRKNG